MILAHGIGGRTDLPIPLWALLAGSALVLVVTFVALAVSWTGPRLQTVPRQRRRSLAAPVSPVLASIGALGLFLVIGQVVPPLFELETVPTRSSIAPVLVWVFFVLVIPFGSALVGNWYADLNPWRTLGGALRVGRAERVGLPSKLGLWPAALGLVVLAWFELINSSSTDPLTLGAVALAYTVFLITAMIWAGRETGLTLFDPFTSYNRLISAISPLGRTPEGRVFWRGWLRALTILPEWPGLWVFVVVMIGTVSYDGASGTGWFRSLAGGLIDSTAGQTLLLLATIGVICLAYLAAAAVAAAAAGPAWSARRVAQRFAHTLVPIALAYAGAHYFTLILFEGQQVIAAVSDPFALGWDLFGTADRRVSFFLASSTPVWLAQVGFIVGGHLVGVVLAHDRSLQDFGRGAVRSQYAMLVLMIALTSLGLLILSA